MEKTIIGRYAVTQNQGGRWVVSIYATGEYVTDFVKEDSAKNFCWRKLGW